MRASLDISSKTAWGNKSLLTAINTLGSTRVESLMARANTFGKMAAVMKATSRQAWEKEAANGIKSMARFTKGSSKGTLSTEKGRKHSRMATITKASTSMGSKLTAFSKRLQLGNKQRLQAPNPIKAVKCKIWRALSGRNKLNITNVRSISGEFLIRFVYHILKHPLFIVIETKL